MDSSSPVKLENKGASAEAIQHHYDVSNDFYEIWLDKETRAYSSALWSGRENESLEEAQINKVNYHIEQSGCKEGSRMLDVGCGWGGVMFRAVDQYGAQCAKGLTLSPEQAAFIRQVNNPRVDVEVRSWTDYEPEYKFDAIISVGAFEHFASLELTREDKIETYRNFFKKCHAWLNDGGKVSLQTMTYENSLKEDFSEFFETEIFPESDLPRISDIALAADCLFEISLLNNHREHYARTYREWFRRLKGNREQAVAIVGEEQVIRFEKYMQLQNIAFHTGRMGLARLTLRKLPKPRRWDLS